MTRRRPDSESFARFAAKETQAVRERPPLISNPQVGGSERVIRSMETIIFMIVEELKR